jgi:DNA processing protein
MTAAILEPDWEGWPAGISDLAEPPDLLWISGEIAPRRPAVAVVGSRNATVVGKQIAQTIGRELAHAGMQVISGFARGIDAAAHLGALEGGGSTIAVLGTGIDVSYPYQHAQLRKQVMGAGSLLTEYPPGTLAAPFQFPRRNRLIAAMADAVVVVEARMRSGALSTARWAADLGRDVLAVPGSIRSPVSLGTNLLIKDGARPYLSIRDLLEVVYGVSAAAEAEADPARPAGTTGPGARVLEALTPDGVHPDDVARALGVSFAELAVELTALELAGYLITLPGGLVARAT